MTDHQQITAERGRRAADLRAAAVALLEQQSIAAGVMLDLDDDTCVAAGPKSAILHLLSKGAPAATSGDAPDLQQLKALALAAKGWSLAAVQGDQLGSLNDDGEFSEIATIDAEQYGNFGGHANAVVLNYLAAANPAVVLDLIAHIERERAVAASWQRTAEKKDRDWNEARMAFENYKCAQRAASGATASGDELPPLPSLPAPTRLHYGLHYRPEDMEAYGRDCARAAVSAATKPTAELSKLTRYGWKESYIGDDSELIEDAEGTYVRFADVQSLLATKPAAAQAVPVELAGVAEEIAEGSGFWRECSGCYDTEDGHPTQQYDYSKIFGCALGNGCSECGGIGAVWDNTDYEAMARDWDEQEAASTIGAAQTADQVRDQALEEAASICDQQASEPECPERAIYCAEAIRALKGAA